VAQKRATRIKAAAAVAALGCAVVGGYEGLRLNTYLDVVGIPTVCYGETRGIKMGMKFTKGQCDAMLVEGLDQFAQKIEACVPSLADRQTVTDKRYVAHLSLAYNIGTGAYCKSTVARRQNAGDQRGACDAFMMWNRAGGFVLKGLTKRREGERALCLEGL